jgi:non-canonical (house-cleaning) NTP pyrophosphatase
MKDLTIAVGTVSAQKLGYVRKILKKLGVRAVLLPANVSSGVSEQPLSSAETKRGARKRAVLALTEHPAATLGLGIEVGYEKNKAGRFEMFCWAVIVDKEREVAQLSHAFVMPDFHQAILKKGGFLMLTAGGDDEKVGKGKKIIIQAVIGLLVVLVSYAASQYVISKLLSATGSGTGTGTGKV